MRKKKQLYVKQSSCNKNDYYKYEKKYTKSSLHLSNIEVADSKLANLHVHWACRASIDSMVLLSCRAVCIEPILLTLTHGVDTKRQNREKKIAHTSVSAQQWHAAGCFINRPQKHITSSQECAYIYL